MLEEKNDNLQNADGNTITGAGDTFENGYLPGNEIADNNEESDNTDDLKNIHETEGQLPFAPEEIVGTNNSETKESAAVDAIEKSNAEEGEDNSTAEDNNDIPELNYEELSMEELTVALEKLASNEKVMLVKDHVENTKKEFYTKYNDHIEQKKQEHSQNNDGEMSGFEYDFPLKRKFDDIYYQYRNKKNDHFKKVQNDLKGNLENRLVIIEELKNLVDSDENMKDALKHVGELRDKWKQAGPIPRDKYNHVWNNFHFHMERFYDHLHLDREARDMDFKHNLEQKQRIIARVEELLNEQDIVKAFRELQSLHKMWKEEIGPVSREHREDIWNRFSELTKQLHDKREAHSAKIREKEVENLANKKEIIAQIEAISKEPISKHSMWQGQIQKIEALREAFFKAGKVPIEVNEDTWAAFKGAVRNFNNVKNSFYKEIKKSQQENLDKKQALVAKAQELKDSEDFANTTNVMKQIQEDWKKVGHVPRKYSDSLWKEFKAACNHYFDKLHAHRNEANKEEIEAFEKKKEYLESIKEFELTGDHKTDLDAIKKHIEHWKSLGRVPQARRHIEGKFNKVLDTFFDKLSLSKKETDMVKFANRLEQLAENEDHRKMENEQIFIMRKIDEVQSEILQLENNIQFISNAKSDNPFIKEVNKSIDRHKEDLKTWKEKLRQIKNFNKGS
ncbi:MAG: chromosome segregation protein [Flavobacterium sp. MedPE-SWcel]|uniref:DUF349 domain-containing protein n=1 Tax=uncultured Flavobacterium sp. TaxID=165435 RepID=UPI00091E64AC|nr:DUF349 domain-containing protein [uncultured Flavobacterium sp.]OIQ17284.1 MAG: chromosome segregation protein [Flavobacterium sp. MedPE-SWcel]